MYSVRVKFILLHNASHYIMSKTALSQHSFTPNVPGGPPFSLRVPYPSDGRPIELSIPWPLPPLQAIPTDANVEPVPDPQVVVKGSAAVSFGMSVAGDEITVSINSNISNVLVANCLP